MPSKIHVKCPTKLFRDAIHGYIEIPANLCEDFIDTPIFQRLRNIRQTNMCCLFPAANHNRFSHSIGVYHLGKIAFDNFINNISSLIGEDTIEEVEKLEYTFVVSCLMHDCGHAPFSHTFENLYIEGNKKNEIDSLIIDMFENTTFKEDFDACECAAHEKISVIVFNSYFADKFIKYEIDPELSARMIIGCLYHNIDEPINKIKNCLITMLNSNAIDVDKLDYIIRDTWVSGVSNNNIDVKRLLSSLTISTDEETMYYLAFKKNSLSVIKSVVDGRNFLYKWIYSHPKILYETELIKKSVDELGKTICDNIQIFNSTIFSLETFFDFLSLNNHKFHLTADDDIITLLRKEIYNPKVPSAKRLLCRDHHRALWKTHGEFTLLFSKIDQDGIDFMIKNSKKYLYKGINKICGTPLKQDDIIVIETKPKEHIIKKSDILIKIEEKCYPYTEVFGPNHISPEEITKFFYIYYPKEVLINSMQKQQIVNILRLYK